MRGWHGPAHDRKRGVGIVNNDLYRGQLVWNRCRWVRQPTDSKKRRVVQNPQSEWVRYVDDSIRIVPDALWYAVKRRQDEHGKRIGERIARGVEASRAGRTGRNSRYLLSGLLRCAACGSSYVMVNTVRYACSGYVNGRVCSNSRHVRRDKLEQTLLTEVQTGLLGGYGRDAAKRHEPSGTTSDQPSSRSRHWSGDAIARPPPAPAGCRD